MIQWFESYMRLNLQALRPKAAGAVFTVHYWGAVERHFNNFLHKHSFFEVCYVLKGEGTYTEEGTVYPLRGGTMFCSRPEIVHRIQSELGMELLFVAFEPEEKECSEQALTSFQALAETAIVSRPDSDGLPSALLWRSLLVPADGQPTVPEAALPALTGALLLSFPAVFGRETAQVQQRAQPHRSAALLLKQAKLYIRDNLADNDLSLAKVAEHINISPRHLSRIFSSNIHESYSDYVRQQRVRKSAELLLQSDLSIKAVAEATGFGSVHYYTRTFSDLMKTTPAKYRDHSVRGN